MRPGPRPIRCGARFLRRVASPGERDRVASRCGLQAAVVVPVIAGTQLVALEFFSRAPIGVDREIEGFMRSVASQLAQYLQRKQAETALRHVASHDALTGLASRPAAARRWRTPSSAPPPAKRFAVMFVDLDRFKHINDRLGHSVGDVMLQGLRRTPGDVLRENDTVARFGGDEFVLRARGPGSAADAIVPLRRCWPAAPSRS